LVIMGFSLVLTKDAMTLTLGAANFVKILRLWAYASTSPNGEFMADTIKTIKVVRSGLDPETGGEAITIQVQYDGRTATVLLKSGWLPSKDKDLRDELDRLAKVLQEAPISHSD